MTLKTIKQKIKKAKMSMMVIYLYGTGLITLFVMFIASWLANTAGYNTNTQMLINFWNSYTTAAVIGAIGFVSIFSVKESIGPRIVVSVIALSILLERFLLTSRANE